MKGQVTRSASDTILFSYWRKGVPLQRTGQEDLHAAARGFFDDAERENVGPNYKCPFIDPYWGLEKIKSSLKQ